MTNQKEFIAGAAGGLAGVVTGYPFDTVKGIGLFSSKLFFSTMRTTLDSPSAMCCDKNISPTVCCRNLSAARNSWFLSWPHYTHAFLHPHDRHCFFRVQHVQRFFDEKWWKIYYSKNDWLWNVWRCVRLANLMSDWAAEMYHARKCKSEVTVRCFQIHFENRGISRNSQGHDFHTFSWHECLWERWYLNFLLKPESSILGSIVVFLRIIFNITGKAHFSPYFTQLDRLWKMFYQVKP